MTTSADDFSQWVGHTECVVDDIHLATATAAAAMFDDDPSCFCVGAELPPLWHWFYFLAKAPQAHLGDDGHPKRTGDGFMPPIPYPRRMFAARLKFHQPLIIGQAAKREAVIRSVALKSGRSGALAFVTVGHRFLQENALCIEEEQDIVYRQPGPLLLRTRPTDFPSLPDGTWSRRVMPDPRMLFRFSALTFNAHRIHYDRQYAIEEEGYPGLVVHGPLTAVLLLRLVREHTARRVTSFSFRGQSPLFDLAPFRLVGSPSVDRVELHAQGPDGKTAMAASADLEPQSPA